MQVPAKFLVFRLTVVLLAGALILGSLTAGVAASESVRVAAVAHPTPAGLVELRISWSREGAARRFARHGREELLAVSFDTRRLVFDSEEAPFGKGADGEVLARLERVAGADGARRLFVIPEAQEGYVVLRFRTVYPGAPAAEADPFRIWLVYTEPSPGAWIKEMQVPST